jgi:hypothetical protein
MPAKQAASMGVCTAVLEFFFEKNLLRKKKVSRTPFSSNLFWKKKASLGAFFFLKNVAFGAYLNG